MPADDEMSIDERRRYLKRMATRYGGANLKAIRQTAHQIIEGLTSQTPL